MEITSENFIQHKAEMIKCINECDFIAIDGEFYGLSKESVEQVLDQIDTTEQKYSKIAASVRDFGLLQFGLSCFKRIAGRYMKFENATYSIYLSTKATPTHQPNVFSSYSNSLRSSGVPYLNIQDSETVRRALPDRVAERIFAYPHNEFLHVEDARMMEAAALLIEKETKTLLLADNSPTVDASQLTPDDIDIYALPFDYEMFKRIPVQRLRPPLEYKEPVHSIQTLSFLNYEVTSMNEISMAGSIAMRFPNVAAAALKNHVLEMRIFTSEHQRNVYIYASVLAEFRESVGFSDVARHLLESGKIVVGHLAILDLCHLIDKFIQRLPLSLANFKEFYKVNVPDFYDTKFIARSNMTLLTSDSTALKPLYKWSAKNITIVTKPGHQSYITEEDFASLNHVTGYEAFMIGVVFVKLKEAIESRVPPCSILDHVNQVHLLQLKEEEVPVKESDATWCKIIALVFAIGEMIVNGVILYITIRDY